ncbi:MAG TPA: LacI family DNA-binding transcriptional regulator [Opitutaceae bacterium]|nr:LacI family DNA-binding transcriptional regulator [Opitutaceae bacterium]
MPSRSHRKSRAGIVEIASQLRVSPSMVSRALRPETAHLVRADRRKLIVDLAEKLHFSPNPGARILRQGANASLAVVVPLDENIFFSEFYGRFLSGTLHAAAARSWDVQICALRRTPGSDFRGALQQLGLATSGLIYLAEPLAAAEVRQLRDYRRPLVLTKSALPPGIAVGDAGVPVVGVDNLEGARAAASLLLQLGHRRIGLLMGPPTSRDSIERRQGYLEVLDRAGCRPSSGWIYEGAFSAQTGRDGIAAMLAKPDRPTAICCASDEIAFGAIDGARAAGLRCPEDISIVGFDDGPWANACRPALTTVRQPLADLAERAVGLIVEAANRAGRPGYVQQVSEMPASIVIRESTQVAPAG